MSYPDLIQQDGRYWVTETQKEIARVHKVDPALFEALWNQGQHAAVARRGLVFHQKPARPEAQARPLRLPNLVEGEGFTVEMWVRFRELSLGQVILDRRGNDGSGVRMLVTEAGTIGIELTDGEESRSVWDTDPGVVQPGRLHHVVAIVDGGPRIITFVVDGVLCDGGEKRQCGWGRIAPDVENLGGEVPLRVAPSLKGDIERLRIYRRPLRTSEAVSNYRAGPQ